MERKKLHTLMKILIPLSLVIGSIALIAIFNRVHSESAVCTTQQCQESSKMILRFMDKSVDPCEDFYNFTCGNIFKDPELIATTVSLSPFYNSLAYFQHSTVNILQQLLSLGYKPPRQQVVADYFASCINIVEMKEQGVKPLKSVLRKLGGFPILTGDLHWDESTREKFEWTDLIIKMSRLGLSENIFFTFGTLPNPKNSSKVLIAIGQPFIGQYEMAMKSLDNRMVRWAYVGRVYAKLVKLGAKVLGVWELNDAMFFGDQLIKHMASSSSPQEPQYITMSEFSDLAPQVNWQRLIFEITNVNVGPNDMIAVQNLNYVTRASAILAKASKTDVANYALSKFVDNKWTFAEDLPHDEQAAQMHTLKCGVETMSNLGYALAYEFYDRMVDRQDKQLVEDMVELLKVEMVNKIEQADWFGDQQTQQLAMDKIQAIRAHVGIPKALSQSSIIDKLYENLHLDPRDYFGNQCMSNRFSKSLMFSLVNGDHPIIDWETYQFVDAVDQLAYYFPNTNSLTINSMILGNPFVSAMRPNYLNFGYMGSILGHEITHSLDPRGREFDRQGNEVDWWDSGSKDAYRLRTDCFLNQFDDLPIPRTQGRSNGSLTLNENVADAGGFSLAYRSYHTYLRWLHEYNNNQDEPVLPQINLNQRQLFWVGVAAPWCDNERPDMIEAIAKFDEHSPGMLRVNQGFANFPEFASDFNCPVGSKMNPSQKCELW